MNYADYTMLKFREDDGVLTIALNRPERLNAWNEALHNELSQVFDDVSRDFSIRAVILTGNGTAFSAGGDMDWLQELADDQQRWDRIAAEGRRIVMGILECRQPVIAKLNGPAAGGGATIALYSDVVFASDRASIGDPHVRVGFAAGDGGSGIWPYLVGFTRAREFLFTGEMIPAARAAEIGLINHVVAHDELDARVEQFARQLADGPIQAIQWTKQAVNQPLRQLVAANLDLSLSLEAQSNSTEEHREGIRALKEKRSPRFRNVPSPA
ncbi:enoyl-CoA hydratase (plasmid) [Rhodococcus oxybenzonivorans]|uniref:Enoyl-CoA hydratase n=1 Tax=Rhodococcus oxybenzonivorans TaxID=1990687 RepID=A0A2S2C5X9_9NOCA|nr:enoyl-CoA hydratase-related protein [Rhodococcus oxybenzonivorans]AWK76286.1 enoyl-CoA hydratase [Rhodococcus oxybenzonivorans]